MQSRSLLLAFCVLFSASLLEAQTPQTKAPSYSWENIVFDPSSLDSPDYTSTVIIGNGFNVTLFPTPDCGNCNGTLTPSITGIAPPYTFMWSNGSTQQQLTNLCAGTYTLTITTANGLTTTASGTVQYGNSFYSLSSSNTNICSIDSSQTQPPAGQCETVCPGANVIYTLNGLNNPTGGNNNIGWNVTGSASWTVLPPGNRISVNWGNPGSGSVSWFIDASCASEGFQCITIVDQPEAAFTSLPAASPNITICKGQTVSFTNQSQASSYFEWDFGDNSGVVTTESPEHRYLNPGTYTVRLIAKTSCFCVDTTYATVEALDAASLELDCVGTVCSGTEVTYNATGNCSQFQWTVSPNGTVTAGGSASDASITVLWNSGSEGIIALKPISCPQFACPEPTLFRVPVIDNTAEISGQDRVCPGTEELYSIEPFGGTNFVWTLPTGGTIIDGQGTNRITIKWKNAPSTSAVHQIYVQYDNCYLGCGGEDNYAVKILPPFILDGPVERCDGSSGTFTSTRTPGGPINTNWAMTAPDGSAAWSSPSAVSNPMINFGNGPGFYRIFATPFDPSQTCSDKAEWAVNVAELPTAPTGIDGPAEFCPGQTVTYSESGPPQDYRSEWTLLNGPGIPATHVGDPLNVTWAASGPYGITLKHISLDGNNCVSDPVILPVSPIGQFTLDGQTDICEGGIGTYIAPAYENVDVAWSVSPAGAGVIKTGQNTPLVEIYWTQPGNHTVTAVICQKTASFPVRIFANPDPIVVLPATGVCPGNTLTVSTTFPYAGFNWETASGTALGNAATVDIGPGSYTVKVSDTNGCKGTTEFSIDDYPKPNVTLSTLDPTGFCNNSYTVTMRALVEGDGLFTYNWVKDGAPLANSTVNYATNQYGTYQVQATNSYGCTDLSNEILIFEDCTGSGGGGCPGGNCPACPPGAFSVNVVPTARCDSFIFHLIPNTALYLPGGATWFFGYSGGDLLGTVQGNDDPTFVFPNAGQFIAGIQAKLTNGITCYVYDSAVVAARAQFDPVPVCPGEALQFEDESTFVPTRSIAGWAWSFDDPASGAANTSAIAEPTHTFGAGGIYDVTLTVTANTGCTSSVTVPLDIPSLPTPVISPIDAPCPNNATEIALNPDPNITGVEWNLGDPASGAANLAEGGVVYHNYANTGNYSVVATATNAFGCTRSVGKLVTIAPNPLAGVISPASPTPLCEGKTRTLTAPSANVASWEWSTGEQTQVITIGTEGVYRVTLTAFNGCTFVPQPVVQDVRPAPDALIKALLVNDLGQVYGTEYPTLTVCQGEDVFLEASGAGTYGYTWSGSNGTGTSVEFSEARGNLLTAGNYNYAVTVTDFTTGCTDISDPFSVLVNPLPAPFSITTNGNLCDGSNTVLTYNGPAPAAGTQYAWSTGESTTSITVNETGGYSLVLINTFGCERPGGPVAIYPGPNVSALPSGCLSRCNPDTICLGNISGVASWQWYLDGNPIPGAITGDFVATADGSYHAVLTDFYGCVKESDALNLDLYDGFGTVNGLVWSDVNDNGVVDAADTLLSGVVVNLLLNSTPINNGSTTAGTVTFPGQPSGTDYEVELDPSSLPSTDWEVVIGNADVKLSGCDDVEKGDLLVHLNCYLPAVVKLNACEGKSVQYHGTTIPAGSSQIIQFNAGSCDSLITVDVSALPNTFGFLSAQVCQGSAYNYQGTNILPGTSQQFVMLNAAGCDSTVTVSVSAIPPPSTTMNPKVCPSDVFVYQGVSLSPGQSQQFTVTTAAGCDSLVTVNVSALPTSAGVENKKICPGSNYVYQGVSLSPGQSQQFTLQNYLGCDSTVTVTVSALPTSTGTENRKVCPGDTYVYQGVALSPGQSQQFTLQNYLGCDSVVTVTVSALPTSTGVENRKVCPGDTYVYQGVSLSPGQSQQFILQNYLGCDSVVTVSVSALAVSTGVENRQVCTDDVYVYQGVSLSPGQSQQFTLQNYLGCDSVVTVTVSAYIVPNGTVAAKVCQGDVYTYQGVTLNAGQSQQFTLASHLGCDSLVTVNVSALPVYDLQNTVTVCPGTTYTYNGVTLSPGETQSFHFTTQEVCDSTITISVTAYPAATFTAESKQSCPNLDDGAISVLQVTGGTPPYEWSIDGATFQSTPGWLGLAPGDYTVVLQDNNDCLFEDKVSVNASLPLEVILPDVLLPCDSVAVVASPIVGGNTTGGVKFLWSNGSDQPQIKCDQPGKIWVEVTNVCETVLREAEVNWADAGRWDQVYVPNVFASEEQNELNREFRPFFVPGTRIIKYQFDIFDRWGNLVFTTENPDEAWSGPMVDRMMQGAVFVWQVKADLAFCGRTVSVLHAGDITLLR